MSSIVYTVDEVRANLFKQFPIFISVDTTELAVLNCHIQTALNMVNCDLFGDNYLTALTYFSAYLRDLSPDSPTNANGLATSGLVTGYSEGDLSIKYGKASGVADGTHSQNRFGVLFDTLVQSQINAYLLC